MSGDTYEVFPKKGGSWGWRLRDADGKASAGGDGYETRADALQAARVARGDEAIDLFTADGEIHSSMVTRGPERIVLLRLDGTVHGELDHELRAGGPAQHVSITPAGEASEAASL